LARPFWCSTGTAGDFGILNYDFEAANPIMFHVCSLEGQLGWTPHARTG
jgi:hypothetical protein